MSASRNTRWAPEAGSAPTAQAHGLPGQPRGLGRTTVAPWRRATSAVGVGRVVDDEHLRGRGRGGQRASRRGNDDASLRAGTTTETEGTAAAPPPDVAGGAPPRAGQPGDQHVPASSPRATITACAASPVVPAPTARRRMPCARSARGRARRRRRSRAARCVEDPGVEPRAAPTQRADAGGSTARRARPRYRTAGPSISKRISPATRRRRRAGAGRRRTARGLLGRYTRPRSRSSATSRRKLVSWKASPRSRAGAERLRAVRLEDRQHHLADHGGRAVHVAEQVVPGRVARDRQVHRHRPQEAPEALGVDVERAHGVHHRLQHRVDRTPAARSAKKRSPKACEPARPLRRAPSRGRRRCRRRSGRTRTAPTRGGACRGSTSVAQ